MNKIHSVNFFLAARILVAVAGIFLALAVVAQEEPQIEGRYLFVFGTSAQMKARIPATQTEINQLLSLSMNGALHSDDSIGVWTLNNHLSVAQFPLVTWRPENAAKIAKEINQFLTKQRYTGTNNFNALLPVLERVIQSSPRLTVLIFCDGAGEINGTPYDEGINSVFKQRFAEQKKNRQPFVVVLRTQFGRYVGSSVDFPPGMVNLPAFPPIPKPKAPPTVPPPVTNPPPSVPVAPLVIIGTQVETGWEAYQRALTNTPAKPATTPALTNSNPVGTNSAETNQVEPNAANTNSPTNAVPPGNQDSDHNGALALAAGFLIGAAALAAIFFVRSRRDQGSLISRSMKK